MSTGFHAEMEFPSAGIKKWKSSGLRMHPEVRRALRAQAALDGVTMPEFLHRVLVERLRDRGLLTSLSGRERPE